METNAEEQLQREFKLSPQQAKWCILVAGGMKGIDAVGECYSFTSKPNAYNHLKDLVGNPKIDAAMKSLGLNLRDQYDKQAYAVVKALEEIAFSDGTSTRDKLAALKELAQYNPFLQTAKKRDADDDADADTLQRVQEWLSEEE